MPTGLLSEIIDRLPDQKRLLALDLGTKTIGLALSNPDYTIATPLKTINRTKFTRDIEELNTVIKDYEVGGFVMGLPLNMDGTEGPRCDAVKSFAHEMTNYPQIVGTDPWIALWDERLSTVSVEDFLVETVDMSRTRRKQVVDKLAAQHILQGALDFIQSARF